MKSSLGPVHHSQVGPKEDLLLLTQQDGMPSLKLLKVQLPAQTRSCTTILILEPWTLYTSWLYVHARRRQYQAFSLMILHQSPWGPKSILWGNPSLCPRHGHGRINSKFTWVLWLMMLWRKSASAKQRLGSSQLCSLRVTPAFSGRLMEDVIRGEA